MSDESPPPRHSYGQTLRSTAMIGGSTVFTVLFGIVRTKAIAVLLGPAGIGLLALYTAVVDLGQNLASLGVPSSGVRQIAAAAGTNDAERIAATATVLRRVSLALGLVGAAVLVVFAGPISQLTFGGTGQATGVALLAIAVFFRLISAGQATLIQGMRRIGDLARLNIFAAAFSTVIAVPLIYLFGERGIVPALIAMAAASILPSWWYSRKIRIEPVSMPLSAMWTETAMLLKLGLVFLASGVLTIGASYAIRIIVQHDAGLAATGLYQSAWTLGGLYTGVILQAMGADFYPRLAGVAHDDSECNRLVNEQAQVCVLLAGPGVIATLTLAPLVMTVFYSQEFQAAVGLLRWICLGMMFRVVAWPMGFIIVAKGRQMMFLVTEIAATAVHIGLAWILVKLVGLDGAGAAFCGLYAWHSVLIYFVVRHISGFRWSPANLRLMLVFLPAAGLVFACLAFLPFWIGTGIGLAASLASGLYSIHCLLGYFPPERLPRFVRPFALKVA